MAGRWRQGEVSGFSAGGENLARERGRVATSRGVKAAQSSLGDFQFRYLLQRAPGKNQWQDFGDKLLVACTQRARCARCVSLPLAQHPWNDGPTTLESFDAVACRQRGLGLGSAVPRGPDHGHQDAWKLWASVGPPRRVKRSVSWRVSQAIHLDLGALPEPRLFHALRR